MTKVKLTNVDDKTIKASQRINNSINYLNFNEI